MLETGIDDKEVKVRAIIDDAISAIIEMDSKRAPADKLKTLVDSSKFIFEAIHASSGKLEIAIRNTDEFGVVPRNSLHNNAIQTFNLFCCFSTFRLFCQH